MGTMTITGPTMQQIEGDKLQLFYNLWDEPVTIYHLRKYAAQRLDADLKTLRSELETMYRRMGKGKAAISIMLGNDTLEVGRAGKVFPKFYLRERKVAVAEKNAESKYERTLEEWAEFLPGSIRTNYLRNLGKSRSRLAGTRDLLSAALATSFVWQTTPEGWDYWRDIQMRAESGEWADEKGQYGPKTGSDET